MRFKLEIDSDGTAMDVRSLASHLAGVAQYLSRQNANLDGTHKGAVLNYDDEKVGSWELVHEASERV